MIEVSYKSMSIGFANNDSEIEFDSEKSTPNSLSGLMRLILNKPFSMVMSRRGEIIEIKSMERTALQLRCHEAVCGEALL